MAEFDRDAEARAAISDRLWEMLPHWQRDVLLDGIAAALSRAQAAALLAQAEWCEGEVARVREEVDQGGKDHPFVRERCGLWTAYDIAATHLRSSAAALTSEGGT